MLRANTRNHAFNLMGDRFAPVIDRDHFLGQSAFDIPRKREEPPANITKEGELFHLEIAVPGFAKEDLEIRIENDMLIIKGKKTREETVEKPEYILEEFSRDFIERQFMLDEDAAKGQIEARYADGLLKLTFRDIPKKSKAKTRKIAVL